MPRSAPRAPAAARLFALLPLAAGLAAAWSASPVGATPSRAAALAAGDYLEDDGAVFRWPGSARDHAGRWWLDSGQVDPQDGWSGDGEEPRTGPAAGLVWNPGRGGGPWTAGFTVHLRAADGDHAGLHRDGPGAGFSGLVGRALGPFDVAAGWRSVYGGLSSDADERDEFEHHRDDLTLGARCDLSPRAYIDLAGDWRLQRNRMQAPGDPAAWDTGDVSSSRSWSARARAFIATGASFVLTPAIEVLREDFGGPIIGETWYPDAAWAHDNRLLRLGAALSWLPDPDRLLAITVEHLDIQGRHALIAGDDGGQERAEDVSTLGLRLAAEQRLGWWLSLRASLAWTRVDADAAAAGTDPANQYLDLAAGASVHLGAWGADLAGGGAPLPEPWRWLAADPAADPWLRVTIHREF